MFQRHLACLIYPNMQLRGFISITALSTSFICSDSSFKTNNLSSFLLILACGCTMLATAVQMAPSSRTPVNKEPIWSQGTQLSRITPSQMSQERVTIAVSNEIKLISRSDLLSCAGLNVRHKDRERDHGVGLAFILYNGDIGRRDTTLECRG